MAALEITSKKPCSPTLSDKIDRYGDLDLQIQLFAPLQEEHDLLKREIEESASGDNAERPAVKEGSRWQAQFTAKPNERTIVDRRKLFARLRKQLGLDGVLALINIPLAEGVDKHIPESDRSNYVVTARTGTRRLKLVPKSPPRAA